jgi:hypothetical protein
VHDGHIDVRYAGAAMKGAGDGVERRRRMGVTGTRAGATATWRQALREIGCGGSAERKWQRRHVVAHTTGRKQRFAVAVRTGRACSKPP